MERFWCWLAGFAVAMVLVAGGLIVKREVEEQKAKGECRVKQLAEVVFYEELRKVIGYHPCTLGDFVDKRIDLKLAEKEVGENEGDRC